MNTAIAFLTDPFLAIAIPGTSLDVSTKTILGWVMGLVIVYLAYRCIAAAIGAGDERDKEKRAEQVKWSAIIFGVGLAIFSVLLGMGLISLGDVQSAMNAI